MGSDMVSVLFSLTPISEILSLLLQCWDICGPKAPLPVLFASAQGSLWCEPDLTSSPEYQCLEEDFYLGPSMSGCG